MSDLADRYGSTRRSSTVVLAIAVVLAGLLLAWLAWVVWDQVTPEVTSELVSWEVQGEHAALARVDVELADRTVRGDCTVRAFAEDHTTVGERTWSVPDADSSTAEGHYEISIRTERRATSVELVGCTTANQSRPR